VCLHSKQVRWATWVGHGWRVGPRCGWEAEVAEDDCEDCGYNPVVVEYDAGEVVPENDCGGGRCGTEAERPKVCV
jgi:hypothetical protein